MLTALLGAAAGLGGLVLPGTVTSAESVSSVAVLPPAELAGIEGTVTDRSSGVSLEGIEVEVTIGDVDPVTTETDSDGRFEFTDLPVHAEARVRLTDSVNDYLEYWTYVDLYPGEISSVDVALTEGGRVTGTVVDHDGEPVVGACVGVGDEDCVSTDESGRYTTPALYPGDAYVTVDADVPLSFAPAMVDVVAGTVVTVDFAGTVSDAVELRVTAADTGLPVDACVSVGMSSSKCSDSDANDGIVYLVGDVRGQRVSVQPVDGYHADVLVTTPDGTGEVVVDVAVDPLPGITGRVVDSTGQPVAACVSVYRDTNPSPYPDRSVCAGGDGVYRFGGLSAGSYYVRFGDQWGNGTPFVPVYFPGVASKDDAEVVTVADAVVTGIDGEVARHGVVSGIVRDSTTLAPLGGVSVYNGQDETLTSVDGSYSIPIADPGSTITASRQGFLSNSVGPFTVLPGEQLTGIDIALEQGGRVDGTVTNSEGGISGACVTASRTGGFGGSACTNAAGHYTIRGLEDGNYTISFNHSQYHRQYYSGVTQPAAATPVSIVDAARVSGIDAELLPLPRLEGTVVAADTGELLSGLVQVQTTTGGFVATTSVTDGSFSTSVPPGGPYVVRASTSTASGYLAEFYDGSQTRAGATTFTVAGSDVRSGINFTLDPGGRVSGTVSNADGPLAGVNVYATAPGVSSSGLTDASGSYEIRGLATGSYTIMFGAAGHRTEYFDDAAVQADAEPVSVTAPTTTSGIDAELERVAVVSGMLEAAGGEPLTGSVDVLTVDGDVVASRFIWGSTGAYEIEVPGGTSYVVRATADGYATQYYDGVDSLDAATQIEPAAGDTIDDVDFALEPLPKVTGTVVADGIPISGITVNAYRADNLVSPVATALTGSNGTYELLVPAGNYVLGFRDSQHRFLPEYWLDQASPYTAAIISIDDASIVANASLARGGRISGTIHVGEGDDPGVYVYFSSYDSTTSWESVRANPTTGVYTSPVLPPGRYLVQVYDSSKNQWIYYDGVDSTLDATVVTAVVGETTTGIDFDLDPDEPTDPERTAVIEGTVTAADTGAPLSGVCVQAFGETDSANDCTDTTGHYEFEIRPGTFSVRTYFTTGAYLPSESDSVTVADEETVTVDFELEPGGFVGVNVVDERSTELGLSSCAELRALDESFATSDCGVGSYSVGPAPAGDYLLYVDNAGRYVPEYFDDVYESEDATPVTVSVGSSPTVDVALALGASAGGSVVDASTGEPVSFASVSINGDGRLLAGTSTGTSGDFVVTGILPGTWPITVEASGYEPATTDPLEFTAGGAITDLTIELQPKRGEIEATITDEATEDPVAGACTYLYDSYDGTYLGSAYCADADGVVRFIGLEPGQYFLATVAAGYQTNWMPVFVSDVGTTTAEILLSSGAVASGTVLDVGTGEPVSFATVAVRDEAGGYLATTSTDETGAFVLSGIDPGSWPITIEKFGYRTLTTEPFEFTPGGVFSGLAFELQPQRAEIEATIRDATTMEPIAGACTYLYDSYDGAYLGSAYCSDADGAVRFIDLQPGEYYLATVAAEYPTNWMPVSVFELEPTAVEIYLSSATGDVTATVVDGDGEPIANACTFVYGGFDTDPLGLAYCSGADGVVRFVDLAPGSYYLATVAQDFEVSWDPIDVIAGELATPQITLVPTTSQLATVTGRIATESGPAAGVCAFLYEGESYTGYYGCSDDNGDYLLTAFDLGDPRTFTLRAFDAEARFAAGPPVDVELGNGLATTADLTVSPVASVSGRVTSEVTGSGLDGACVYLYTASDEAAGHATCTRSDGYWVLAGVPDGDYKVGIADTSGVHRTWWSGNAADLGSASTISVAAGAVTTVDASMQSTATLHLVVADSALNPVEGICVYLYETDGTSPAGFGSCTDASGTVTIVPDAGTYRVALADPLGRYATAWYGGTSGPTAADVTIDSFVDLGMLQVAGFGDLSGTVADDQGNPVAGVVVYLNNASDGSYSGFYGVTDGSGVYAILGLPEGYYTAGFYPEGMGSPTTIWYFGATDEAAATWIYVPAGGTATGVDAIVPSLALLEAATETTEPETTTALAPETTDTIVEEAIAAVPTTTTAPGVTTTTTTTTMVPSTTTTTSAAPSSTSEVVVDSSPPTVDSPASSEPIGEV
jgi:hypothetical protein